MFPHWGGPTRVANGERKSRSSPRHHHLQHSDGEKLKYQNAFGGSVGNIGGAVSSSEKYHKYFPHNLLSGGTGSGTGGGGGYFDLSDKLDSLHLGSGSRGSEKSSLLSGIIKHSFKDFQAA